MLGSSANGSPTGQASISRSAARAHRVGEGLHPPAVERRQHQPAVAQVLGAVEQQHGALADHGPEHRVGLAGAELLARSLEELLDQRRVEHHHEPPSNSVPNVTASPKRRRQASMNQGGAPSMKPAVWRIRGSAGPAGARLPPSSEPAAVRSRWPRHLRWSHNGSVWRARLGVGLERRARAAGRLALEVGERQRVAAARVERPGDRSRAGRDPRAGARRSRSARQPGVLVHRLAGHHHRRAAGQIARAHADRAAPAGVLEVAGCRSGRRPRARARSSSCTSG